MKDKFLLIDGNLMLFQSFYATYNPNNSYVMQSQSGITTNGIYQFFRTLYNLLNSVKPKYIFIAFDAKEKTNRHLIYPEYKAGRRKAPEIIFEQFHYTKELLSKLNIPSSEINGAEADDLIATLSKIQDVEKIIFSKDQDLLQLVNDDISILYRDTFSNQYSKITKDNFEEKYLIKPNQIPDYKAINGDNSDNLPGVKGIGKIGAIKLLKEFGTWQNIYNNLDKHSTTVQKKLVESQEMSKLCYDLAKLNYDVEELDLNLENYFLNINYQQAKDLFLELGLENVLARLESIKW
ncbi:5'-3' exonuclease [Mycoplasmopsis alligatoris]|uniref:5'-3' exonuclease n=1 Tax=Mycoplasmopsis alligatoris A21JP2 TaxID=747682 RepID=D4XW47_9BACT|nr:5'-3' exonuclease [Mycoplasmopsis alligatoris]EFF41423.1 5'-3' exonuclease, SAM domain protein [Mycoplasmopsis alligatoris A21JP2]